MPISPSVGSVRSSPLRVSFIRTSLTGLMLRTFRPEDGCAPCSEGAVDGLGGARAPPRPGRSRLVGGGEDLAAGLLGARLDVLFGGLADALLALLGLGADPLGLGLQLLLGAQARFLGGLAF